MLSNGSWTRAPLLLALLGGCAPAMVSTVDEQAAIRARTSAFLAAAQRRDVDALAGFHTPTAALAMPNAPLAAGGAQVRASWSEFLQMPGVSISWEPTSINVASSGDLATEFGTYTLSFDSPAGKVTDRGHYTTVWQKVNGQWLVANDIATSSQPLPTPPVPPSDAATAMAELRTGGLTWSDLELPGFAPGLKFAILAGDPSVAGGAYALRLRFPAGYEFPVHWHPNTENLTVVSGTFRLAMGNTMDRSALRQYAPGDYLFIPGGMSHWGNVTGETVIQLLGIGPFAVNLGPGTR